MPPACSESVDWFGTNQRAYNSVLLRLSRTKADILVPACVGPARK